MDTGGMVVVGNDTVINKIMKEWLICVNDENCAMEIENYFKSIGIKVNRYGNSMCNGYGIAMTFMAEEADILEINSNCDAQISQLSN